jgi:predicted nucleic acid-binding protein
MPDGARWLLDTNILLRMSKSDDPHHAVIREALRTLVAQGARLCFTSQILGEFWNASTRPRDRNGFGLSTAETDRIARVIERGFELLPDSREVHDRWRQLLIAHDVKGVKVHDARLAASMYVHGVAHLLTLNVRDFQRFEGLHAIHPAEVTRATRQS